MHAERKEPVDTQKQREKDSPQRGRNFSSEIEERRQGGKERRITVQARGKKILTYSFYSRQNSVAMVGDQW